MVIRYLLILMLLALAPLAQAVTCVMTLPHASTMATPHDCTMMAPTPAPMPAMSVAECIDIPALIPADVPVPEVTLVLPAPTPLWQSTKLFQSHPVAGRLSLHGPPRADQRLPLRLKQRLRI